MSRHSEAIEGLLARQPMPAIVAAAAEQSGPVLCVGGAVRDALLGRQAADIDIAVGGDLAGFIDAFARHCGRRPGAIGDPWRDTHRTFIGSTQVDIGRMLGDETEDLGQRDFSINAMAIRLPVPDAGAASLIDLHGGLRDLQRRSIRMLSSDQMRRDPLRMLRAVRYTATLEGFVIEAETEAFIARHALSINAVAAERAQAEWLHLLAGASWAGAVKLIRDLGLDEPTLGGRVNPRDAERWRAFEAGGGAAEISTDDAAVLRLSALLVVDAAGGAGAIQRRLAEHRWPLVLARRVGRTAFWARRVVAAGRSEAISWAREDTHAAAHAARLARALAAGARRSEVEASIVELEGFARRAREERWVTGVDLRNWGMYQGPALGALLREAARGQIERRWPSAREARAWARRQAAERGSETHG